MYPTLTSFPNRKRKKYDASDLLAPSLASIKVYIYYIGKKFCYTYLTTTEHEMILSYAKTFSEKIHQQLVTIWKKKRKKKQAHDFSTLLIHNMEKRENTNLFC